ncbi:uncharacterized protein LY89DRAFT_787002 [Mollisia scopiformis]|uniref:Uncharacterized protein n=1 Tax=Mollisia scopiformis TaxID=149040 RepID=A0A194WTW5_MOLSC|nr:uncharacterized protein LY89DRAFT_787002 [Mollisia scopiformis]KUJ11400.1 hypothetical protein LY89DRAFT_787002 [Mollisia scopiformis]
MRFQLLAVVLFLASLVRAQTIGAFYSLGGPTVVSLDPQTNTFVYNVYSKKGFSLMNSFAPTIPPKNGTSIACVGYSSPSSVYGSIYYQTSNNSIAQQLFKCSYASGNCVNYGGYLISANVTIPIKPNTGLSAALLSADLGYRITYEDIYGAVRQIGYSNTTKGVVTPWADGVLASNSTSLNGSALATTFVQSPNTTEPAQQTIYQLVDDQILPFVDNQATAMNQTQSWVAAAPITNLPNWYSTNASFATVIYNQWLMLFYIDTTRQLQWLRSTDGGGTWQAQPSMDTSIWPLGDTPNAPVAAATSINSTADNSASVFYTSNGTYVQAIMTNWNWVPYVVVQPVIASNTTNNTTIPLRPMTRKDTKDIKIGASTGGSVGFLIIIATIAWLLLRKKKVVPTPERPKSIGEWRGSESEFSGKAELHGQSAHICELDHDPECLLLHQLQLYRMYELKGDIPVELQDTEARRPELDHTLCKCELDASVTYELPTCLEKEMSIAESSGRGKEVAVSVKELPAWSWDILSREGKEKGDEEARLESRGKEKAEN